MISDVMFSSATDCWDTPKELVQSLAEVFHWDLDVCASSPNVCPNYFNSTQDGLAQNWQGLCWMNPPYGRSIGLWMKKALETGDRGQGTVVCLVPARTDTKWWHETVPHASVVVFIRGRLKFGAATSGAPFPSAFVVFGDLTEAQLNRLSSFGIAYEKPR